MLDVLARWNRWGSARLDPGHTREVTARLAPFITTKDVVALVGPRRAGKTTVLFQVMEQLTRNGVAPTAMLHVNLEDPAFAPERGPDLLERLYRTYREEVHPDGKVWLFLDEIQRVREWERWVRMRCETDDVKVFVTGSSSSLLSRELGTLLTGRHVEFRVWPLGFREYLAFHGIAVPQRPRVAGSPPRIQHALASYLRWGGFPEVVLAREEARKEVLLKQYFDDVLFKDVALRHEVRDLAALRSLAVYLMTQTAGLVSAQRVARQLGISVDLARTCFSHLQEAFLVEFLPCFSLKAAERARNPQKVHAIDTGLRNAVCLTASPDRGRLAETAVVAAMRRRDHDGLYYWKAGGEVDVVERRGNSVRTAVQVCFDASDPAVQARETSALTEAGRVFRAMTPVLVLGRTSDDALDGIPRRIRVVPLWRFLLDPDALT